MINFIVFFMDLHNETKKAINIDYPTVTIDNPSLLLSLMCKSIKASNPMSKITILTDKDTVIRKLDVELIRYELEKDKPILSRTIAWVNFLSKMNLENHFLDLIFIDYDTLIQGNLNKVFDKKFDLGFTYRDNDNWPINAGVIFIQKTAIKKAEVFFTDFLKIHCMKNKNGSLWGGDQDILAKYFSSLNFKKDETFEYRMLNMNFLMLPCSKYNFSSSSGIDMISYYKDKEVLHFKGRRKKDMLKYWTENFQVIKR